MDTLRSTHSMEELQALCRESNLSTIGTKDMLITRLNESSNSVQDSGCPFSELSLKELQSQCKQLHLPSYGNKAVLVQRLSEHKLDPGCPFLVSIKELQSQCKHLHLPSYGTKAMLVQRLSEHKLDAPDGKDSPQWSSMECNSCTKQKLYCDRGWPECYSCRTQQPAVQCKYPTAAYAIDKPPSKKTKTRKEMKEVVVEEKCVAPSNRSFGLSLGWDTPEQKAQGHFLRILDIYKQRCPEEIQSVLRKGDQLLFIEGQAIEDIMDVKKVTNRAKIGSKLTFTMLRSVPKLYSSHRCVDCASHNRRCDRDYPTCEVCNELEMECHYPENSITITEGLVNDEKKRVEDAKTAWQEEVSRRHAKKTQRSKQRCRLRGCGSMEQPYYGLKNEDWRRCSAHKTSKMVRLDPQCAHRHCQNLPEWAFGDDGGRVCKSHKLPLMYKKECLAAQCSGPREYGYFDGVPQFCKRHKLDSMCMGGARGWEEVRASLEKKDIILGKTRVHKLFMDGTFTGVVTALNRGFYTVTYEDGDTEELNFDHLKQYVSSHTQNQVAEEQEDGEVELLFAKCPSEISVPNPQQIVVLSSNEGSASSSDEDSSEYKELALQSNELDSTDDSDENRSKESEVPLSSAQIYQGLIKDKTLEGNSDLSKTTTKELAHALRFYRESYLSVKTDGTVEMGGGGKCPELGNAIKTVKKFKRKIDKWHRCTARILGAESTVESEPKQPSKITKDQTKDKKDVISHLSAATMIDQGQETQPKNNTQGEVAKGDDAEECSVQNCGIQTKDTQTTSILDYFDDVPLSEFYDKAFEMFEEQAGRSDMDLAEQVDSPSHLAAPSIFTMPEVGPNKRQKIRMNMTKCSNLACKTKQNDIDDQTCGYEICKCTEKLGDSNDEIDGE